MGVSSVSLSSLNPRSGPRSRLEGIGLFIPQVLPSGGFSFFCERVSRLTHNIDYHYRGWAGFTIIFYTPWVLRHSLAKAIKSLRLEQGMTQETLAWDSHLSVNFISELERGRKSPTIDSLEMICGAMDIPVSELVRRAEDLKKQP
jgi:DNA-binding XRE family transcriptional regulator